MVPLGRQVGVASRLFVASKHGYVIAIPYDVASRS